jgi:hypothetical protein
MRARRASKTILRCRSCRGQRQRAWLNRSIWAGLAHATVRLDDLLGRPKKELAEAFHLPANRRERVHHFRLAGGYEVDILAEVLPLIQEAERRTRLHPTGLA